MAQLKFFPISELVTRLSTAASENRYDQVSRNVHAIFESQMQKNPNGLISSADFKNVYNTFAGLNNQSNFKNYFSDVFETKQLVTAEKMDGPLFSRDNSLSEDFRPIVVEVAPNEDAAIKAASLTEIQKVVAGIVDNPQYRFKGYTKVANVGGFANWTVAFETGHGVAEIAIPVIITEDAAHAPNQFSSAGGRHEFSADGVKNFARSYVGERKMASSKSGLQYLGTQSIIPTDQFVTDVDDSEPIQISFGDHTQIDENLTASVDGMETSTFEAIERARIAAVNKISKDAKGNKINNNIQLAYAGSVRFEDMPNDEKNFNGIIAFNASRKTRFGTSSVTIPVEVRGGLEVAETFVDQSKTSHELSAVAIDSALGVTGTEGQVEDADVESFSDAFLASIASYTQLCNEMKQSIYGGNLKRANAVIRAIANRFEDSVVKNAMDDYLEYVKDAASKKAGPVAKKDWHTEMDDHYTGTINSSSIFVN